MCNKQTAGQCKGHIGLSFPVLRSLGWGHFSASSISDTLRQKKQTTTGNRGKALQDYPFQPLGSLRANLAHLTLPLFTFYTDIGVKGRLLSSLSIKCASREHRGSVKDTLDYHFPPSDLGCRGTT